MPRNPVSDPLRFQLRQHTRVPIGDGERHVYGIVLWDEVDLSADLKTRSNAATEKADELAESLQTSIALGIVSSEDPDRLFQAIYFVRPSVAPGVPLLSVIGGGAQRGSILLDCLGLLAPIIGCVVIAVMVLLSAIGGAR